MLFEGKYFRIGRRNEGPVRFDEYGNLGVTQVLPPRAQLAAAGKLFVSESHAGTAIAPVTAPPTTSPAWGLYNKNEEETLVILEVACFLKGGTAGVGLAILGATALGKQTVVTADYSGVVHGCTDGTDKQPGAFLKDNPTLINGTPPWHSFEQTKVNSIGVDAVGSGLVARPEGVIIARPDGGMACFEIVGEVGSSALFTVSILYAKLLLDLHAG